MSRRVMGVGAAMALVLSGLTLVASTSAVAATPSGADLAAALDAPAGVTASLQGDPLSSAVSDVVFNDFPSRGQSPDQLGNSSYVLLSTGKAADVFSPSVPNKPSTDLGAPGPDTTTLSLDIESSEAARCLLVDFSMGTEERVNTYVATTAGDQLSVRLDGSETEWARNAGGAYIDQVGINRDRVPAAVDYQVNAVKYWHTTGDPTDPAHGTAESPRLPAISPIDNYTSRDTAQVPLPAGASHTVTVTISDAVNGTLDSVALVDRVRFAPSCADAAEGMVPSTGIATGAGEIKGHRGVGNVLTLDPDASTTDIEKYDSASNGWFAAPVELRFRWYRSWTGANCYSTALKDWVAITNADRQSYVPTNLDKGKCLMVLVTGVKDGFRTETFPTAGQGWYVTLPIQEGAFDGQAPTIACDIQPTVGMTLSASIVDFVPKPDSYSYQWYAGSAVISGATATTYVVTADEAGKQISVRVKGRRAGFDDRTEASAPCGPVDLQTMTTTPRPILTGATGLGDELGVSVGDWVPAAQSYAYQWRVDNQNISGATRSTYTTKVGDVGRRISVAVTGAKTGYAPVTQVSDPITVGLGQLTSGVPVITGRPVVNGRLSGSTSGWTSGTTLTYIWSMGGRTLQVGTGKTFLVPPAASGKSVVLTVRGTRTGYGQVDRSSAPTARAATATMRTTAPRVTGRPKVGKTVRATASGWGPGATLTYRWMVNGRYVGSTTTKSTLKIKRSWKGKRISVLVTGRAVGYTTVARKSAKSAKVVR